MHEDVKTQFIEKNPTVKEWLKERPYNTQKNYALALRRFCKFSKITPEKFQQLERKEARDLVWEFVKTLRDRPTMAHNVMAALKSFYRNHDGERLPFDSQSGGKHYIQKRRKKAALEHVPTNEEVFQIADHCISLRDKAIVITLFQSGIRVNGLTRLKYGMIRKGLQKNEVPIRLRITDKIDTKLRRTRTGFYDTFIGSEAIELLRRYCEEEHANSKDEDLLFPSRRTKKGLTIYNIWKNVKKAIRRAGLDEETIWVHSLRKAFKRQVRRSNVNHDYSELLMGHVLHEAQEYYVSRNEIIEELKQAYTKVDLSREETRAKDYVELNAKIETLKQEREALNNIITRQSVEIQKLREHFDKTKDVGKYTDFLIGQMKEMQKQLNELTGKKRKIPDFVQPEQ